TTATTAAATTPEAVSSAPQGASALVEAEKVIREARDLGLKDTDIPTEIRFPMVGLELDSPGEAERRLADAVAAFRARLTSLSSVKSVN
ncbi:MAG TPA: hypothetical protein H9867_08220, partial [Candidatus Corynebacterium gallistercoris]|nr:hypothetical protein [Candidatus Corynebacterium gallistercoris]